MQPLDFIIENFHKGKESYPTVRRGLNILFSLSITSYLFEKFHYQYQWLDVTDYKAIADFFVRGAFIIPLLLFIAVHCGIELMAYVFFMLTIHQKSAVWIRKIGRFKLGTNDLVRTSQVADQQVGKKLTKAERLNWVANLYLHLKAVVEPMQWAQMEQYLRAQQTILRKNFVFLIRLAIVLSIYFIIVPHLGVVLYLVSTILTLLGLVVLWFTYLLLEILPVAVQKVDGEMQRHVQQITPNNVQNANSKR